MHDEARTITETGFRNGREFREVIIPPEWNAKTERIIGLAMEVHTELGPGLHEKLYEDALCYELVNGGFEVDRQFTVRPKYKSIELSPQRLDLVVDKLIVLELKSVDSIPDIFLATLMSYLRAANMPLGLLINFNVPSLRRGIYRKLYAPACPPKHSPQPTCTLPP